MNKLIIVLILIFTSSLFYVQALDLREDKNYAKDDWRAYSVYDIRFNKKVKKTLKERAGTYFSSRNIWVYTKGFSKRFGMPKRWIGDVDFKGALALAYRNDIIAEPMCGYFGDLDNCKDSYRVCKLDAYLPHNSKTIPWNTKEKSKKKVLSGYSTVSELSFRYPHKYKQGYLSKQSEIDKKYIQKEYGGMFKGVGIDSIGWAHRFKSDGFGGGGGGYVTEFHRNVLEGIDVITIGGMCNFARSGDGEMQVWLNNGNIWNAKDERSDKFRQRNLKYARYFTDTKQINDIKIHKNVISEHKIYPGQSFMQRVKAYDTQNEGNSFFNFFKQNINQQPTK